jgi:hypothetical protein
VSRQSLPRPYLLSSLLTLAPTVVATTAGLSLPGLYRDHPLLLPQIYGRDLLTLVAGVPALAVSLYYRPGGRCGGTWSGSG